MKDFLTVSMDGNENQPIVVSMRKSLINSIQINGKSVTVLLGGHDPITFNLPGITESRRLYTQIATEMEKS